MTSGKGQEAIQVALQRGPEIVNMSDHGSLIFICARVVVQMLTQSPRIVA